MSGELQQPTESQPNLDEDAQHTLTLAARTAFPQTRQSNTKGLDNIIAVLGAVVVTGLVVSVSTLEWTRTERSTPAVVAATVKTAQPAMPDTPNPFSILDLEARAAVVYDVRLDKDIYTQNAAEQLALASLTKVMTTLLAVESLDADTRVVVTPHAIETEGDSGLFAHEEWSLGDLVSFTMLASSNDGADALAAAVGSLWQSTPERVPEYEHVDTFVSRMNVRARELGLTQMTFNNATGLDQPSGEEGGVGSARDMSRLLTYAWQHAPEAIESTTVLEHSFVSRDGYAHTAENTNEHIYTTPGLIGSKTGYTDLAGGNLAIIFNAGLSNPITVVVLGSTREGRFEDVHKLVEATYAYIESGWYEYEMAGSTPRG